MEVALTRGEKEVGQGLIERPVNENEKKTYNGGLLPREG